MYSETITGVTILRAFGASSKFLRDMLRAVDTVRIVSPSFEDTSHFHRIVTRLTGPGESTAGFLCAVPFI
jgi:hypothetical protein